MNIIENLTPNRKEETNGIDDEFSFEVTSAHSHNDTAEWNGQTVKTEELEQDPQVHETDDGEVIELAKFKDDTEVTELEQDTLEISRSDLNRHSSFFTDSELEELSKTKHHTSQREQESVNRVEEALNDPSLPNDRRSLWLHLCKEEGKFGMDNEDELSEAEKDAKMTQAIQNRGYDVSPENPENKKVENMTGSELSSILNGDSEPDTEELEENQEVEFQTPQIQKPDTEIAELAANSFNERGGVWEEFGEDLAKESQLENTRIESLEEEGFVQVRTTWGDLQTELMRLHNKDEKRTQVLDMDDGTMVARAYEGDLN